MLKQNGILELTGRINGRSWLGGACRESLELGRVGANLVRAISDVGIQAGKGEVKLNNNITQAKPQTCTYVLTS